MEIASVDIFALIRSIKRKHKFETPVRMLEILQDTFEGGVSFRGVILDTTYTSFFNKFSNREGCHFYFKCPLCSARALKIYSVSSVPAGCRKCCKIKSRKNGNSQAERVMKLQGYLGELISGKRLSFKKKKQLMGFVIEHYNKLDDKYKYAYNTFVFKEIQNWCLDRIVDEGKSSEYKKAVKDMLSILRDSKKILTNTKLVSVSKKDLKI